MASRTRSSRMPRWRSWVSTMWTRSRAYCSSSETARDHDIDDLQDACGLRCASRLALAAPDFYIEADYPVLVAYGHDGNISRDIVFRADDLLRSLGHVGG